MASNLSVGPFGSPRPSKGEGRVRDNFRAMTVGKTPHLNPLPFARGEAAEARPIPKLAINEHYPLTARSFCRAAFFTRKQVNTNYWIRRQHDWTFPAQKTSRRGIGQPDFCVGHI